jgi:DNA-binding response OmpR family regulator
LFSVISSKNNYGVSETPLATERSQKLDARTLLVFATTHDWLDWALSALANDGFDCIAISSSAMLRKAASQNQACAAVCDGDDNKAIALISVARNSIGLRLPIVATTSSVDPKHQLALIEAGVDQIVHNTTSHRELIARLAAMLRRHNA